MFRALANINRLKIIEILSAEDKLHVTEIANRLKISLKATSNHLAILKNLDVLEARGALGHVFYSVHQGMPRDFLDILKKVLKVLK